MTEFTPLLSLLGGVLIGLSAVLLMLTDGRIAGISGIVGSLFPPYRDKALARSLAFILGLVFAPLVANSITDQPIQQSISSNIPLMIAAGLLVGFGSVWGSGCTSGHGVCGIARFSPRSFLATAIFLATGFVTVFIARHIVGA